MRRCCRPPGSALTSRAERTTFRLDVARREGPAALAWTAGCIVALGAADAATHGSITRRADLQHAVVVIVLTAAALVMRSARVPVAALPTITAISALVVVGSFQLEVWHDPTSLGMAYVLLTMVGFGPFVLSPGAMGAAAALSVTGCIVVANHGAAAWGDTAPSDWVAAGVAAVLVGAVILRLRLRSIDALAAATVMTRELAIKDPLTGIYNRRGIEERVSAVIAAADAAGVPVVAFYVDIDGLKTANDRHGHDFGDALITAMARAVQAAAQPDDLIGRWGGDEFVVIGPAAADRAIHFTERLHTAVANCGLDPTKWSGALSVGCAMAGPDDVDLGRLLGSADQDMYARRRSARSS